MPLMKIASTAIDQVNAEPEYVRENCLRYLRNDTVCYWATDSEDDRLLKKNQEEKWKKVRCCERQATRSAAASWSFRADDVRLFLLTRRFPPRLVRSCTNGSSRRKGSGTSPLSRRA